MFCRAAPTPVPNRIWNPISLAVLVDDVTVNSIAAPTDPKIAGGKAMKDQ